jgi:hypothetical protein
MASERELPGGWSRTEATLTLCLLLEDRRRRRARDDRLVELAELIGRSPGSISFKLAGFVALGDGDSPKTRRVSSIQREVHREYRHRPERLLRDTERLRAQLIRTLPTARVEAPAEEFPSPASLRDLVLGAGFPWTGCREYDHGQGAIRGLAVLAADVLTHPREARQLLRELDRRIARGARRSEGARRVEEGTVARFLRGVVQWKFPSLHFRELSGPGVTAFLAAMTRPEIHSIVVAPNDARGRSPDSVAESRDRVRTLLALSPNRLCPSCLLLTDYLAGQIERKLGSIPTAVPASRTTASPSERHLRPQATVPFGDPDPVAPRV